MRTSASQIPADQVPAKPGFAERHGPFILAIAFHAALFALLHNYSISRERIITPPEPEPILISLQPEEEAAPEPPQVAEAAAAEPQPEPEQVPPPPIPMQPAATVAEQADEKEIAAFTAMPEGQPVFEPSAATEAAEPEQPPEEIVEPEPVEEQAEPVEEIIEEMPGDVPIDEVEEKRQRELAKLQELEMRRENLEQLNEDVAKSGSQEIADRLTAEAIKLEGKKWQATTEGVENGVIRALDVSSVPADVSERVLKRYGIDIYYKYMDGSSPSYGFLNQARTSSGTYVNRAGRGMYQVFSFGQQAISRMMTLEAAELEKRNLDPASTRIVEITYGIVRTTRGYDLGVTHMETAPVNLQN